MGLSSIIVPPPGYEPPGAKPRNHPLYLHYEPLWRDLAAELATFAGRVLDVGCGLQPYRGLLGPGVTDYVGFDRKGPLSAPDVEGDAHALPFPDGSFDAVMSTQVLEHVLDPRAVLRECARVLRPGGRAVFTVPGCWPAHEQPHDYWRFTRFSLEALLCEAGFDDVAVRAQGGTFATLGQMVALELRPRWALRPLVPIVNRVAAALDRRARARQELVMNWLALGVRR